MRALTFALLALPLLAPAAATPRHLEGRLPSGATYVIDVPAAWNGKLLLYSHGYAPGPDNPARNAAGAEKEALLGAGYALAGSSYARTGWAVEEAVPDQLATLDAFNTAVRRPERTFAWGSSMGGLVTIALMEQAPARFDGAVVLCASAAGTVGMMNAALDGAWSLRTLVAPDSALPVLLTRAGEQLRADLAGWRALLDSQQATAAGRARIALAGALGQVPDWSHQALDDAARQQLVKRRFLAATMLPRDTQLARAGGNPSWNTGIDYADLLARSGRTAHVRALYTAAGLDLDADLARLAAAPRISADPEALDYMRRHYAPSGRIAAPLLLMQTAADPMTLVEMSGDYARRVREQGRAALVHEVYLGKEGHCNFEVSETLGAIDALVRRARSGRWEVAVPGQIDYRPAPFLRRWPE